jgi:hypothetical protein
LNALAEGTSGKVNCEEEYIAECRTHVQTSQWYIQQLLPWIEQAEIYLTKRLHQIGALNLIEQNNYTIDIKYERISLVFLLSFSLQEFLEERRRMLHIGYPKIIGPL